MNCAVNQSSDGHGRESREVVAVHHSFLITLHVMDTSGCTHVENIFADDHIKAAVLAKYSQIASWSVHRLQAGSAPAKRRKVCSEPSVRPSPERRIAHQRS
jgi:hypothetical protein